MGAGAAVDTRAGDGPGTVPNAADGEDVSSVFHSMTAKMHLALRVSLKRYEFMII